MSTSFLFFKDDSSCKALISEYKNEAPAKVATKLSKIDVNKRAYVLAQIKGLQKGSVKFPKLASHEELIYPPHLSLEQSSSELTAMYKAGLFKGESLLDLTAGFGVDDYYFSSSFEKLKVIEENELLFEIIQENFKNIGLNKIKVIHSNSIDYINNEDGNVDLIYLDPSRRIFSQKVFKLEDCEPNIVQLLPRLKERTETILLKISPMMDISEIYRSVKGISCLHVLSVNNECKEIIVSVEKNIESDKITCVELGRDSFRFTFSFNSEKESIAPISKMSKYVYLPNVAITKAGAFKSLCENFKVNKISLNTHVYTSEQYKTNFPGNVYKTVATCAYKKEALNKISEEKGFTILKRNFPDNIKTITKKLGILVSGKKYLLAYKNDEDKPELCLCERISA